LNDGPNNKRFGKKCELRSKFPITTFSLSPYYLPGFYPDTFVSTFFSNTLNAPLFLGVTKLQTRNQSPEKNDGYLKIS
jgi:hypothetical protein